MVPRQTHLSLSPKIGIDSKHLIRLVCDFLLILRWISLIFYLYLVRWLLKTYYLTSYRGYQRVISVFIVEMHWFLI